MPSSPLSNFLSQSFSEPSPKKGRSLRSGRTLPDPEVPVVMEPAASKEGSCSSMSEMEEDEVEVDEEEEEDVWDMLSTASSDISDWTTEVGISFISPSRKRTKRRRQ